MAVLSELRYPTTALAKVVSGLFALLLFAFIGTSLVAGYLLHQILKPPRNPNSVDLNVMMGHPSVFTFNIEGGEREGWFFPGQQGAPTIIVCHGYGSQRSDVLTLVTALQDQQYNVFIFDFSGHGTNSNATTLGYREADELRGAINALAGRSDIDVKHFGIWGKDMGGYAALEAAEADPRVAALAVDSAYDDPIEMLDLKAKETGLTALPFVTKFCEIGFKLINYPYRQEPPVSAHLGRLLGTSKLFIQSQDLPNLAYSTFQLFAKSPDPKRQEIERLSYSEMGDDDRKAYENMIVSFFLLALPASAHPVH
ncbi:MAG: alpha/beta fold hydrolase [Candidatus Acidiferrales bacterium]